MLNNFIKKQCKSCSIRHCKTTKDVVECWLAYLQFRKDYIEETKEEPII